MKRKKLLGSLFLGITLAFTAVGCGSDNDSAAPKERSEGPVLTQEQQKQQLDATARKFMGSIHPDDFKVLDNLAYYVEKHYLDDQSVEPVNNWAKGILQSMTQTIATGQPGYTEYARIIDATKYRGRFEHQGYKWVRTKDSQDLEFLFRDQDGNDCLLAFTVSDKAKAVRSEFFNSEDTEYVPGAAGHPRYTERTKYKNTVMVPEDVRMTLQQGDRQLLSTDIHTDLTTSGDLNLAVDQLAFTCKTVFQKYEVIVHRAFYKGPGDAEAGVELKADGKTLLAAKATGHGLVSNRGVDNVGSVNVAADILGELQVKGTCSNGSRLAEIIDRMEKDKAVYTDEARFKKEVADANSLLDVNVYYSYATKPSAGLLLGAMKTVDDYSGRAEWISNAQIKFTDGTTYAVDDYFSRKNFAGVFKEAGDMINAFKRLFNF